MCYWHPRGKKKMEIRNGAMLCVYISINNNRIFDV